MRKAVALGLVTLAISALVGPTTASAAGRVIRVYQGVTSSGGRITVISSVRDGVVRFQGVGLEDVATCEDSTTVAFTHGLDFSPRGLPMTGGIVDLDHVAFSDAFFVDGTLGTRLGSGTVTHLFAALDDDEQAQLCTTGEMTWTAQRVESAGRPVTGSVVLTETNRGVAELAALETGASTAADELAIRERFRNYEGRTSARLPLFFITSKRPEGVVLLELGISWELTCEDGASATLGVFILFAGEPLGAQRVDYDARAPEVALHVNGRLGVHGGSGTTSMALPALTSDLQAQTCDSGDTTWRAWRTDAGARPL